MKIVKTLVIAACAGLLSVGTLGSARHAFAQDANGIDQSLGDWSAPSAGNSDESTIPDIKAPPMNISGCWSGEVTDTGDGVGTAAFQFVHRSNPKKLVFGSTFSVSWSDQAMAFGPLKGTVSSTGFKFKGNAGRGCAVSGSGTGNETALTGTIVFAGICAKFFQGVTFAITPGCI